MARTRRVAAESPLRSCIRRLGEAKLSQHRIDSDDRRLDVQVDRGARFDPPSVQRTVTERAGGPGGRVRREVTGEVRGERIGGSDSPDAGDSRGESIQDGKGVDRLASE